MEDLNFKPKVLITDDDMAQRMILRMTLEEKGYEVQEAEDGHEALSKLFDDIDIRFLMTDLEMPGMDGYSLIQEVREKELQYTYIIVLTSMEERGPLIRALSLRFAYEIAMYHHEKWDGSGYPQGLAGESIPLTARIMALADVYDALCSKRCYKEEFSHEKARSIIIEGKGNHFDSMIVDSFLRQEGEWLYVKEKFADEEQN